MTIRHATATALALAAVAAASTAFAQASMPMPNQPLKLSAPGAAAPTLQGLRNLPADATVQTRSGRVVPARQVVALADALRATSAKPRQPSETGFSRTQAAASVQVRPGTYLPGLLSRPANEVVQLPNGVKMTVGDLNKFNALMQRVQGRSVAQLPSSRANLAGPALRINSARELERLRDKPDATVLENRNGVRVTLGELRAKAKTQQR
jgi:hypothetical protein